MRKVGSWLQCHRHCLPLERSSRNAAKGEVARYGDQGERCPPKAKAEGTKSSGGQNIESRPTPAGTQGQSISALEQPAACDKPLWRQIETASGLPALSDLAGQGDARRPSAAPGAFSPSTRRATMVDNPYPDAVGYAAFRP